MILRKFAAIALLLAPCGAVVAQEGAEPAPTVPAMREIEPGIFEVGQVRIDQKKQTVSFPAALNLNKGLLEYLIVSPRGGTHESLLVSNLSPSDVHFAMLLLGAKGSGEKNDAPPAQIDAKYLKGAPKLKGDTVTISVKWQDGDKEKTVPVEDWLFNNTTKEPIEHGPWLYNGSMFYEGRFLAFTEGIFAAVVTNPSGLINNPRKGNDNDQIWGVNEKAVPAVNTPVEVIIKLVAPAGAPAEAKPDAKPEAKPDAKPEVKPEPTSSTPKP